MDNPVSIVWHWLLIFLPALVYWDAASHKIGKIKGDKHILNMAAGGWAGILVVFPVGWWFVVVIGSYLAERSKLIKKAKLHPVEIGQVHLGLMIALLIFLRVFLSYWQPLANEAEKIQGHKQQFWQGLGLCSLVESCQTADAQLQDMQQRANEAQKQAIEQKKKERENNDNFKDLMEQMHKNKQQ